MCVFVSRGEKRRIENPSVIPQRIREFARAGVDCVLLEIRDDLYLVVVINRTGMAIIFHDDSENPRLLDASTFADVSHERVNMTCGGQHTPLPRNMRLSRKVAIEVLRHFCETGGDLSPQVFWLPEKAPNP